MKINFYPRCEHLESINGNEYLVGPRGGISSFNLSSQFLDMVISTFQVSSARQRNTTSPVLGLWGVQVAGVGSLPGDSDFFMILLQQIPD